MPLPSQIIVCKNMNVLQIPLPCHNKVCPKKHEDITLPYLFFHFQLYNCKQCGYCTHFDILPNLKL